MRIETRAWAIVGFGMTIQMAFYDAYAPAPTDVIVFADRAQHFVNPSTGEIRKGRMDSTKIGPLGVACAISLGGGTIHQNRLLARLLGLPEVSGDDIDYMDDLGAGRLGPVEMSFNDARDKINGIIRLIGPAILAHEHPLLNAVLVGRDDAENPRIVSWGHCDGFKECETPPGRILLFPPNDLADKDLGGFFAAIAPARATPVECARIAVSYCASRLPICVSREFQYARLSQGFEIKTELAD